MTKRSDPTPGRTAERVSMHSQQLLQNCDEAGDRTAPHVSIEGKLRCT